MTTPIEVGESGCSAPQLLDSLSSHSSDINPTLKIKFTLRHIEFIKLILNLLAHDYLDHRCLEYQVLFKPLEMQ